MIDKRRIEDCLFGGAVGDALGAAVEFISYKEIVDKYGAEGITEMDSAYGEKGCITDDTQLTLFTAYAISQPFETLGDLIANVRKEYINWLFTQNIRYVPTATYSGLLLFEELWGDKGAGETCLRSFEYLQKTGATFPEPNDRKGCGALMRSAPFGLMFQPEDAFKYAKYCANLSHNHIDGVASAAAFAYLISLLVDEVSLTDALDQTIDYLQDQVGECDTAFYLRHARNFAKYDSQFDFKRYDLLGQGWTAEETLAISVYCALTAPDFRTGVLNAVNHDGDSDSTGAIAGNILGLKFGTSAIPERWLEDLSTRKVVQWTCDTLYASQKEVQQ